MVEVEATATTVSGVAFVCATVWNTYSTPQRVRVRSTVPGPTWSPRDGEGATAEWTACLEPGRRRGSDSRRRCPMRSTTRRRQSGRWRPTDPPISQALEPMLELLIPSTLEPNSRRHSSPQSNSYRPNGGIARTDRPDRTTSWRRSRRGRRSVRFWTVAPVGIPILRAIQIMIPILAAVLALPPSPRTVLESPTPLAYPTPIEPSTFLEIPWNDDRRRRQWKRRRR
ncbi:hypothetical protein NGM29_05305 [Natronosalvus rutilus]|uniref:Uncharacterized protein n=1 Tax=Natronosalvus rutilus TaxID=2953753 RepID=A0A9E7NB64_9EURY|nr:hypothetical protein NGM29_05305 [Natronosalvus rutilus]